MGTPKSSVAEPADVDRIISSLKQILVQDLNVGLKADEIDPDASLEEDLKIDSVRMVELISAIETRFEFSFLDSDLVTQTFANLRVLAGVIARRIVSPTRT
jgi:acyl carrier protein